MLSFFTNRNENAISSISKGNPVSFYYHIFCFIGTKAHETKKDLLEAVPLSLKKEITRFLSTDLDHLETSMGLYSIKQLSLPSNGIMSYKGVLSLKMNKNSIILKYYSDKAISAYEIDVNKKEMPVQHHELIFLKDIASRQEEFHFHEIYSAIERDEYIFVDHRNKRGERELKTFSPEDSGKLLYRDTGNRMFSMSILEEDTQPDLEKDFIIKNLYPHKKFDFFNNALRSIQGEICDVINPTMEEYYFLTWHSNIKEGRIYYSSTEKRIPDEPLIMFRVAQRPKSFTHMRTMNAFLVSLSGISDVYLAEPFKEIVNLKSIGFAFSVEDESFSSGGEIKDLFSQSLSSDSRDILIVVQKRKMGVFRIGKIND